MQGRRIYWKDGERNPNLLESGDYAWDSLSKRWWIRTPNGILGGVSTEIHKIIEHEDRTITVSPSILTTSGNPEEGNWHGYLEKGIWREV